MEVQKVLESAVKDYGRVSVLLRAKYFRKRCSRSLGCKALLCRGHTDKTAENVCKILWTAELMRIEAIFILRQKQSDSTAVPVGGWNTSDT